jgi:hypothetical protein
MDFSGHGYRDYLPVEKGLFSLCKLQNVNGKRNALLANIVGSFSLVVL